MLRRKRGLREVEENNLEIKRETVSWGKRADPAQRRAEQTHPTATERCSERCITPPPPGAVKWRLCPRPDSCLPACHLPALSSPAAELLLQL